MPDGLSIEMRTNRWFPPSFELDFYPFHAFRLRHALHDFFDLGSDASRIVPTNVNTNKKWAFAHYTGSTLQPLLYRVRGGKPYCGRAAWRLPEHRDHRRGLCTAVCPAANVVIRASTAWNGPAGLKPHYDDVDRTISAAMQDYWNA
jgi:hypothetical protein